MAVSRVVGILFILGVIIEKSYSTFIQQQARNWNKIKITFELCRPDLSSSATATEPAAYCWRKLEMFNNAWFQFLVVFSDGYWVSQLMVAIIRYMFVKYPIEIHNYIPNNSDSSYKNLIFCRLLWWSSCIIKNRKWCINVSATVESPLFSSHSSDSVLNKCLKLMMFSSLIAWK